MGVALLDRQPFRRPGGIRLAREVEGIATAALPALRQPNITRYLVPRAKPIAITDEINRLLLLTPGLCCPGTSLDHMAKRLTTRTTLVVTWGDLINTAPTNQIVKYFFDLIKKISDEAQRKIDLGGHSLGGLYGYHAAHELPDLVENVYSFGSPIELSIQDVGTATNVGFAFQLMMSRYLHFLIDQGIIQTWAPESTKGPLEGQRTSFIAAHEGVVDPYSCIHPEAPGNSNFIIDSGHSGLITNELVIQIMGHFLENGHAVPLPEHLQAGLLDVNGLDALQGRSAIEYLLQRFSTIPANGLHKAKGRLDVLTEQLSSIPDRAVRSIGNGLFGSSGSRSNADPTNNVFPVSANVVPIGTTTRDEIPLAVIAAR